MKSKHPHLEVVGDDGDLAIAKSRTTGEFGAYFWCYPIDSDDPVADRFPDEYPHSPTFDTAAEAEAWADGYNVGCRENM